MDTFFHGTYSLFVANNAGSHYLTMVATWFTYAWITITLWVFRKSTDEGTPPLDLFMSADIHMFMMYNNESHQEWINVPLFDETRKMERFIGYRNNRPLPSFGPIWLVEFVISFLLFNALLFDSLLLNAFEQSHKSCQVVDIAHSEHWIVQSAQRHSEAQCAEFFIVGISPVSKGRTTLLEITSTLQLYKEQGKTLNRHRSRMIIDIRSYWRKKY